MSDTGRVNISPLIATILLIAFSFALGAVVLSWGESFVEERAEFVNDPNEVRAGCNGIEFMILELQGSSLCSRENAIEFVVDNLGSDLSGLQVKLIASDTIRVYENALGPPLAAGETRRISVPHSGSSLQQVRIVPTVLDGGDIYCPSEAKVINTPPVPC